MSASSRLLPGWKKRPASPGVTRSRFPGMSLMTTGTPAAITSMMPAPMTHRVNLIPRAGKAAHPLVGDAAALGWIIFLKKIGFQVLIRVDKSGLSSLFRGLPQVPPRRAPKCMLLLENKSVPFSPSPFRLFSPNFLPPPITPYLPSRRLNTPAAVSRLITPRVMVPGSGTGAAFMERSI